MEEIFNKKDLIFFLFCVLLVFSWNFGFVSKRFVMIPGSFVFTGYLSIWSGS